MSDIRFNRWLHQSGTGGVHQDGSGNVGIGSSAPTEILDVVGNIAASGDITAVNASFSGDISIGGTLTYDDVTNIDSVGIVTAQSGIHVTSGSVGVGTDNPDNPLHVLGADPQIKIQRQKHRLTNINFLNNAKLETLKNLLLNRVNVLPISMMLAQAIVESGWGGSRFAQKGNALFGQWTWDKQKGISPTGIEQPNFAVKSFKNLQDSVDAYILNLNTHPAYSKLRNYRELIRDPKIFEGQKFSRYLDKYAIIGFEYVKKINLMIKKNNLEKFNSLSFKLEN